MMQDLNQKNLPSMDFFLQNPQKNYFWVFWEHYSQNKIFPKSLAASVFYP